MKYLKLSLIITMLLMLLLAMGCSKKEGDKSEQSSEGTTQQKADTSDYDDITLDGMANDVLKQMTLDEKIGQLFIVCTDSLDFAVETSATQEMKDNLEKFQPGGVILFSFNIDNREQTSGLINDMQDSVSIPMFVGVDEEGGQVARIANNENMGTTAFPSMSEIGATGDPDQAKEVGETIGKEISALGFNLDFAPVADVLSNNANSEIGDRSFGSDPELVGKMVAAEVKGLQSFDVSATLKHFPGQGSSTEDTHKGYSNMNISIDSLRKNDFIPFKKGIKAGADFVMVSHVAVSDVTGNDKPSSLSGIVVTDILRKELQFDGVIITDAMNMKSITKFYDADEAAVAAFKAGNDIILMPDDFQMAYEGIKDAVDTGKISEEDIDDAVIRILKVKIKRGIIPSDSKYFL